MSEAPTAREAAGRLILDGLSRTPALAALSERLAASEPVRLSGATKAAAALVTVDQVRRQGGHAMILAATPADLDILRQSAAAWWEFFGNNRSGVACLPPLQVDPGSTIAPHDEIRSERTATLARIQQGEVAIVVTTPAAIAPSFPPPDRLAARIRLTVGDPLDRTLFLRRLVAFGYRKEWRAEAPGDYALRGGIIDLVPARGGRPLRLELEGDCVCSLRTYSAATQRSHEEIREATVTPAREHLLNDEDRHRLVEAIRREAERTGQAGEPIQEALEATGEFPGMDWWAEAAYGRRTSLRAMFPDQEPMLVFWVDFEQAEEVYRTGRESLAKRLADPNRGRGDRGRTFPHASLLPPLDMMMPSFETLSSETDREAGVIRTGELAAEESLSLSARPIPSYEGRMGQFRKDLARRRKEGDTAVILTASLGTADRVREILAEEAGEDLASSVPVAVCPLETGFEILHARLLVYTEAELLGRKAQDHRERKRRVAGKRRTPVFPVDDFRDLKPGDFIVHIDNGIGRFDGLTVLGEGDLAREMMQLTYRGDDRLYVPLDRLDLIEKYRGPEGTAPRLDKLGGASWARTKQRVRKAVRELGEELLKLYARRAAAKGHPFAEDAPWQREMENAFPYEETEDQLTAIADVKKDMESDRPMDRLLCGDVGFGKTEVAMRAAFKAVMDGKQMALLAPTTVLANQHLRTFRRRLAPFPVRIEMLSRMVPKESQKVIVKDVEAGTVDILIGTHRLLAKDVHFKDLGLLIVDEEQRFGVAQKERLKKLKLKVDVLSMSATPIPRTLQMALSGAREISLISSPPRNRISVQTVVRPFRKDLVQFACQRELSRGGQIFFLHNRVESIDSIAGLLRELVPEARIAVAHGQMRQDLLSRIMLKFVSRQKDILVATTIIENGLDIPSANTLIINRADRFGLSELYQLRGRVGRSDRRAYALLLVPSTRRLTPTARKRLAAIEEFSELGAGFRLAALDLEIRGGGNLLGARQHGHIQAIGFDLYMKLLNEEVRRLKGEELPEEEELRVEFRVDLRIPGKFLPDEKGRMELYRRVAAAPDKEALEGLERETTDLYGRLPRQVTRLFRLAQVRKLARRLHLRSLTREGTSLVIKFHETTGVTPAKIIALLDERPGATLKGDGTLRIPLAGPEIARPVETARDLLRHLAEGG